MAGRQIRFQAHYSTRENPPPLLLFSPLALPVIWFTGCNSASRDARITNPNSPGRLSATRVGTAVGAVGSNVVGGVVRSRRRGRRRDEENFHQRASCHPHLAHGNTSDGRTIKVPVEIEVDENGKPIRNPATAATPADPAPAPKS